MIYSTRTGSSHISQNVYETSSTYTLLANQITTINKYLFIKYLQCDLPPSFKHVKFTGGKEIGYCAVPDPKRRQENNGEFINHIIVSSLLRIKLNFNEGYVD